MYLRLLWVRVFGAHRVIGVRADLTEHAFLEGGVLAESYDFETSDGLETYCDFVLRSFERHFVEGVTAHGRGASARLSLWA